jgi:thiamine biosynthesis lipoprotein
VGVGSPAYKQAPSAAQEIQAGASVSEPLEETILLANTAVSTSGDEQQFAIIGGVRYSHIVDPRTGVGLTNQLQVSILAKHATDTDAFATTVCVLGKEKGLKLIKTQRGIKAIFQSGSPH